MKKFLSALSAIILISVAIFALSSCDSSSDKSCADGGSVHNWGSYRILQATCVDDAKRYRECKNCGEIEYDDTYVGAAATGEHTYTSDGVCSVCGKSQYDCDAGEHKWSSYATVAATCGENGRRYRVCLICGTTEDDEAYASKHLATGNHLFINTGFCSNCGTACTHNYKVSETASTSATCTEGGTNFLKCTICGATCEEPTDPLGHDYPETGKVTAPTCGTDGYTTYTCTRCGTKNKSDIVPATQDHILGDWTVKTEATLFYDGEEVRTCSVCKLDIESNILPHELDWDSLTIKNFVYTGGKYSGVPFVNVAQYGFAESSSYYRTTSAKNMVDGNLSTYWQADTLVEGGAFTGEYVTIYLAKEYDVGAVSLIIPNYTSWELGDGCYVSYKIEVLVDGEWIYVGDVSDKDANDSISENATATLVFDTPQTTDTIRATVTYSSRYAPAKIQEVEVYAYAEDIVREAKNIGANATISTSGNDSDWSSNVASYLVDGSLKTYWHTNGRRVMQDDNSITRTTITFKNYIEVSQVSIELEKLVGEKVRLYYYDENSTWQLLILDGADESGWYTISEDADDTVVVTYTGNFTADRIKIQVDGYTPEGDYLSTIDDYAPTVQSVTYTSGGQSTKVTSIDWTEKATTYATFKYPTEQYIMYIDIVVPVNNSSYGREYKFYIQKGDEWIEYANPNDEEGRYVVPTIKNQNQYTFSIDINDNITGFKLVVVKEIGNGAGDLIYEIMPYTMIENEVNAATYSGCKHTLMQAVKDEDGKAVTVAATCTEAGYSLYACSLCGNYTVKTDATDAKGHTWGDYVLTSAATRTTNGEKTATCKTCGATKHQVVPATLYGILELPTITTYLHNAPGAWSMTLDDGNYTSTYEWIIPRLQEYGFKATAVISLTYTDSLVSKWQKYFATGVLDLGSHSANHTSIYSGDASESALISEVNDAHFKFMSYYHGQRLLGFATPNGATSSDVAAVIVDICGAGRSGGQAGTYATPSELTTREKWGNLPSYISKADQNVGGYSYVLKDSTTNTYIFSEAFNRLVATSVSETTGTYFYNEDTYVYEWREGGSFTKVGDSYVYVEDGSGEYVYAHTYLGSYETGINQLIDGNYWTVECIHEIGPTGDIHVDYAPTMSKFEYLKKTGVWVCSYTEAVQYIKESQNAEINFKKIEAGKITLSLTQTLDDYMFNQALTIKVDIPDYWSEENITVTQNGEEVYFVIEVETYDNGSSNKYCYLDAVPNCGDIVISDYVD